MRKHIIGWMAAITLSLSAPAWSMGGMDDTLLGGSMTRHIKVWAGPESSLLARFIDQLAAELRIDRGVWIGYNVFKGFRQVRYQVDVAELLLDGKKNGALPDAAIIRLDELIEHESGLPVKMVSGDHFPTNRIDPGVLATVQRGDKFIGVPIYEGNHLVLYYDKSKIASPPKTWAELGELADKSTRSLISWPLTHPQWMCATVGCEASETGSQVGARLARYAALVSRPKAPTACAAECTSAFCEADCVQRAFYDKQVPMMIHGDWLASDASNALGENLGIAAIPQVVGLKRPAQVRFPTVLAFFSDTDSGYMKSTIKEVSKHFLRKLNQRGMYSVGGRVPVHNSVRAAILPNVSTDTTAEAAAMALLDATTLYTPAANGWLPYPRRGESALRMLLIDKSIDTEAAGEMLIKSRQ